MHGQKEVFSLDAQLELVGGKFRSQFAAQVKQIEARDRVAFGIYQESRTASLSDRFPTGHFQAPARQFLLHHGEHGFGQGRASAQSGRLKHRENVRIAGIGHELSRFHFGREASCQACSNHEFYARDHLLL